MVAPHPNQDDASVPQISFDPTPFLNQLVWKVNRATGNNKNDGLTDATAIQSVGEIRRRWSGGVKGVRPQLPAIQPKVTITGDDNAFADPISQLFDIDGADGFAGIIDFVATVKRSGTINAVPNAFARTPTGEQTVTDLGVADWTADVDQPLLDTTSGAFTWVVKGGAAGTINASRAQSTDVATEADSIEFGGLGAAAVVATNAYEILTLPTCYFGTKCTMRLSPGSVASGGGVAGQASWLVRGAHGLSQGINDIFDVTAEGRFSSRASGALIVFAECRFDQPRTCEGSVVFANCAAPTNNIIDVMASSGEAGVVLCGYARHNMNIRTGMTVDQDHAIRGNFTYSSATVTGETGTVFFGNVARYLDGSPALVAMFMFVGDQIDSGPIYEATHVFYGTTSGQAIINFANVPAFGGGNFASEDSAANTFAFDGGAAATFVMGGVANAFGISAATGLPVGPIALTVGNLDAAQPGGFGKVAVNPRTGSRLAVT